MSEQMSLTGSWTREILPLDKLPEGVAVCGYRADAFGSSLGLADGSGTMQTQYTDDPFGGTVMSGAVNSNPYPYLGLQNDGTDLYFD